MCSTLNPEDAEICSACGARLTPLVVHPEGTPPSTPERGSETSQPEGEDWLARIRAEAQESAQPEDDEPAAPEGEAPDWLGRLREADSSSEEGPPEGELPDWMDDFAAAGEEAHHEEDVPEWLARIRAKQASEAAPAEPGGDADWLENLRAGETPDEQQAAPPVKEAPQAQAAEEGLMPPPEAPPVAAPEEPAPAAPEERVAIPSEKPASPRAKMDESITPLDLGPLTDLPAVPGSPDQGGASGDSTQGEAQGELPHVPALKAGEGAGAPVVPIDDMALDSIELPDWLGELRSETPPEKPGQGEKPDLAPATLPSWLEAMRPVDSFRSEIEIEPEEVQPVESAGPLAGLRGVLMAEPVVAMPRTTSAAAARLEVTERQYAQAELLHRLVEDEERETAAVQGERLHLPLARWIISLALVLSVVLPFSFSRMGVRGFPYPSSAPRDLAPLIGLIDGVPTDRPALVVFDYTPGYSGELDSVAGVMLRQLIGRQIPLATLSTRPTGPPLAERMLQDLDLSRPLIDGQDYLHLGYLSGGPTAVQLFAISPRDAIPRGFLLPEDLKGGSGWDSPLLLGVNRLSDFSAVVVITAGTETARTWAEQTHPWIGDTPLLMVLSAGAEPLVRPYFEAAEPRVDGILTGLPSAVSYQQLNAQPLVEQARWNAFGLGLLVAELTLAAGGGYGLFLWLTSRRQG